KFKKQTSVIRELTQDSGSLDVGICRFLGFFTSDKPSVAVHVNTPGEAKDPFPFFSGAMNLH
ncbi:MAG: hypothetical protein C0490_19860, partial [Marivirga sp.]|nr:hypothetical protein [Marivirga sp.]